MFLRFPEKNKPGKHFRRKEMTVNEDPVKFTDAYLKGNITIQGRAFRERLFSFVKSASNPEEIARVGEALKKLPNMRWTQEHERVLKKKGLI